MVEMVAEAQQEECVFHFLNLQLVVFLFQYKVIQFQLVQVELEVQDLLYQVLREVIQFFQLLHLLEVAEVVVMTTIQLEN